MYSITVDETPELAIRRNKSRSRSRTQLTIHFVVLKLKVVAIHDGRTHQYRPNTDGEKHSKI
ncbi:MAG: hypothetical protein GY777_23665 [Candidatus Brocadiaceae bacterium]|nr:hypothetical protein [Candidatus Brocadiaceae bacterium]